MLKLFRYLKPYWWQVVLLMLATGGEVFGTLQLPALMADIINKGIVEENTGYIWQTGLIMIGIAIAGFSQSGDLGFTVAIIGLLAYCLVAVFQFVTLPVEFNASSRALKTLENMGLLYDEEIPQAKKVLSAAALTYVAALASTLSTILRLFIIIMRNTGRNRRN